MSDFEGPTHDKAQGGDTFKKGHYLSNGLLLLMICNSLVISPRMAHRSTPRKKNQSSLLFSVFIGVSSVVIYLPRMAHRSTPRKKNQSSLLFSAFIRVPSVVFF